MPEKGKTTVMTSPMRKFVVRIAMTLLSYTLFGLLAIVFLMNYFTGGFVIISATALIAFIMLCLIYTHSWHTGHRDRNLVKYGHLAYQRWRGVIAGMYACVPFVLIGVALVILTGPHVQYLYFTLLLAVPAASGAGYIAGHKLYSVGSKLFYKTPKKNDKRIR